VSAQSADCVHADLMRPDCAGRRICADCGALLDRQKRFLQHLAKHPIPPPDYIDQALADLAAEERTDDE